MTTLIVILVIAAVAALLSFPAVRQALRININKGAKATTKASDRQADTVARAQAKLPQLRENVARQMTAAQNAADAVTAKEKEAEDLLTEIETAQNMKASAETQATLNTRWARANGSIEGLKTAAAAAHDEADAAQKELEEALETIAAAGDIVEQMKNDEALAQVYRDSAALRTQLNDMKTGLSAAGNDVREVKDELSTAKNANELSKGSKADREMAEIKKQAQAASAADQVAAALAARKAKQGK